MKKLAFLPVIASLFWVSPVAEATDEMAQRQIELRTTEYLYNTCSNALSQDADAFSKIYCRTFIEGALNAQVHFASTYQFHRDYCLPWLNVEDKIAEVFIKYVAEHPQYYNKPAIFNLFYALGDAYPCPEPESKPGG